MKMKKNHHLQSVFNDQDPKKDQTVGKYQGLRNVQRDTNKKLTGLAAEMTEEEIQNTIEEVLIDDEDLILEKRGVKVHIEIDRGLETVRGHLRATSTSLLQGY